MARRARNCTATSARMTMRSTERDKASKSRPRTRPPIAPWRSCSNTSDGATKPSRSIAGSTSDSSRGENWNATPRG